MADGAVSISALASGSLHHIFSYLSPADLCCVSATCKHWRDLSHDQAANKVWRQFYEQRWRPTVAETRKSICWQTAYGCKMKRVGCWQHKHFQQDSLYGHHGGVHCLGIVPGHSLVATGTPFLHVAVLTIAVSASSALALITDYRALCLRQVLWTEQ